MPKKSTESKDEEVFSKDVVQKGISRSEFNVDNVSVERKQTRFVLNREKSGCNTILFEYGEANELKSLLLNFFQAGKGFDFHISEKLANKRCKIDALVRTFGKEGVNIGEEESQEQQAPETRAEDWCGPIFLSNYTSYPNGSVFLVDDDDAKKLPKREGLLTVGVRVAPQHSSILSIMAAAFQNGRSVSVVPWNLWHMGSKKIVWTIGSARMEY